jgi:hypothetical protein
MQINSLHATEKLARGSAPPGNFISYSWLAMLLIPHAMVMGGHCKKFDHLKAGRSHKIGLPYSS